MKTGFMANNVQQFRRQTGRSSFPRPYGSYPTTFNGYASNSYWGGRSYRSGGGGSGFAARSGGFQASGAQRQGFSQKQQPQEQNKPSNHNWEEEWTPPNIVQHYKTVAMVMWVDGAHGEVVCERNLKSSLLHFYFDGRTEIDGTTVALAARSQQGLGLTIGSKIEFEATYKPLDPREKEQSPTLVHISKITILVKEPEFEVDTISMVSMSDEPHMPKLAMNRSGDFVLISPVMFSKKWVIDCLNTTVVGAVPDYPVDENRGLLFPGRTVTGKVIKSPRWVGDVLGGRINPKIFLISIDGESEIRGGLATVTKLVPSQNVVLEADDFPEEPMFYPIICLSKGEKEQLKLGARVLFNACTELPGFAYKWRVLETLPVDSQSARSTPTVTEESPDETRILSHQPKFPNPLVSLHAPAAPAPEPPKVNSYLSDLEQIFADLPLVEPVKPKEEISKACIGLDDFLRQPVEAAKAVESEEDMISFEEPEKENDENSIPSAHVPPAFTKTREFLTFPSKPPLSAVCHMLGASLSDIEGPPERCRIYHIENNTWVDEYNHIVMTAAEQYAREAQRKEAKSKLKENKELAEKVARELEKMDKEEEEKEEKGPVEKKAKKSPSYHAALSILEPPDSSVRVLGLYDSPFDIFTQLLQENEEKRKAELLAKEKAKAIEGAEKEETKEVSVPKAPGGWWFRRKSARLLPTVLVAELLTDRTEDEVCVDYNVNSLTKTVVLRNKRKSPSPSYQKKPVELSGRTVPQHVKKESPVALPTVEPAPVAKVEEPQPVVEVVHSSPVGELNLAHEVSPVADAVEEEKKKSGLANSLMNDKVFGNFFQSLLKK